MRRVTIATVLFVLGLTIGLGGPALARHLFPDVGHDDTHTSGIEWASERGLVRGYADGRFGPNDNLTRGQLATILERQGITFRGPVYSLTPICGTLQMQVVDHNLRGSGDASVEYSIDGDTPRRLPAVPAEDPLLFTSAGPGVVTLFVDGLAWASTPTAQTCVPPAS
jgi:hypothetical protein